MQRKRLKDEQTEIKNNILVSMLLCDISDALRFKIMEYRYGNL